MKKHYGWVICACCLLMIFCASGLVTISFSTYLPYIKTELGLSNTQTSMISTVRSLSSMLAMLVAGKYYSKLSLRLGTTVACLFLVAANMLFSQMNSVIMCYLASILMGICYAFGTMFPISLLMRNWFRDRRSTAMAIAACGSSFSTFVVPPIITKLVEGLGLQRAFIIEAGFITACSVIIFLIIRDSPSDMGFAPYQEDGYKEKQKENHQSVDGNLRKCETLLLMFVILIVGAAGPACTHHLVLHYVTLGYTGIQAAFALSLFGFVMIFGKLLFGVVSDRFGTYRGNYIFLGGWILASFITGMLNGTSIPLLYLTAFLNGVGIPVGTIGITIWAGELSSREQYARNIQRSQFLFSGSLPRCISSWIYISG